MKKEKEIEIIKKIFEILKKVALYNMIKWQSKKDIPDYQIRINNIYHDWDT